jgi:5-formyltetrahydrofolate cyclo-ligase
MAQIALTAPDKAALRTTALARRAGLDQASRLQLAEAAAEHAMDWLGEVVGNLAGEAVSLFIPIGSEIPTAPLARRLRAAGARLALPVVRAPNQPLLFREWRDGVALAPSPGPGRTGIPAPPENAEVIEPDVLVVPLAAFDASGHRLGYGAGFYDRTLADLRQRRRIEALGYAFAIQQLPALPAEPHDERLDAIATDAGVIRIAGAP